MKKNEEHINQCLKLAEQRRKAEAELGELLDTGTPELTDKQLTDIRLIVETSTAGASDWMARRVEIFSVAWCLQREVLFYRRRLNGNMERYLRGIMGIGKATPLKRDLLFLYRRQTDFALLCDECVAAINKYLGEQPKG